jgi:ATP-dependent Lhr-like helicase
LIGAPQREDRRTSVVAVGRPQLACHLDWWKRRRCFVEPADGGGKARWSGYGIGGASFALSRAIREVLLGTDPPVRLTSRAESALANARETSIDTVHPGGTVIVRTNDDVRWWTWSGYRANATLIASMSGVADPSQRVEEFFIRLRRDLTPAIWKVAVSDADERLCLPGLDDEALNGMKFSAALPRHLGEATLSARLADLEGAHRSLSEPVRFSQRS